MKRLRLTYIAGALLLSTALGMTGCDKRHHLVKAEAKLITIDSTWDARPDSAAMAILDPYKHAVDSMMNRVRGVSAVTMDNRKPEGLLSNLVADVLRSAATEVLGHPADMGLVNRGGIRNILSEGSITTGNIFEILPFENSLCVLTISGKTLKELFVSIAARGGEGVSGVKLIIGPDNTLIDGWIDGKPVDDDKEYTVATIDYLADGNDGMVPLMAARHRVCPPGATLRGLFMDYVDAQTTAGKPVTSKMEGRITVKK